jgi:hypothetical protein
MARQAATQSGAVSVLITSTAIAGKNPGRREITICNDHATQVVYLALATVAATDTPVAVVGQGIRLNAAGGSWTSNVYDGPIAAIGSGAATTYTIVEF